MEIEETITADRTEVRRSDRLIISGLAGGHAPFHWFLQSFLVVLPEIQSAFHLSALGVGGILTTREVASGIVALPGGVAVDVLRRYWGLLLAVCLAASSLGALIMGLTPFYPFLLIGIGMVAMSHSIWHLAAAGSLSHHFPHKRGMALSFHGVGGSVGDVAGPVATGAILGALSWRGILSLYAAIPLFLAFLIFWSLKNIGGTGPAKVERVDLRARVELTKELLRNRVLWGITLVRGLRSMALVAILTLLPLYLANELGLSPFSRGVHIGLLIAIGIVAKPIAGHLSDRLGRKQVLVPSLLCSCALALLLVPFGQGYTLTLLIALLGLFLYPDQPVLTAAALDVVGTNVATTALGITAFASFLLSATSPLIAGGLYESIGAGATLYYVASLFALSAVILAALPLTAATLRQRP